MEFSIINFASNTCKSSTGRQFPSLIYFLVEEMKNNIIVLVHFPDPINYGYITSSLTEKSRDDRNVVIGDK